MHVTKYLHSCLLIQQDNTTILLDPGQYTYDEKALDVTSLNQLDYILITHEHFDHMSIPFLKELVQKFPSVQIISNPSVQQILAKEHITVTTINTEHITHTEAQHEKLFDTQVPKNYLFTIFDILTHPGDSFHFESSTPVLALPVQAPWGSLTEAVEKVKSLNPRPNVIIPIHDYHWKDNFRKAIYTRLEEYFKTLGIDFKKPETGEVIAITL